jgi:hypothetical protein
VLIVRGTKKLRDRVQGPRARESDVSTTLLGDWFATALFWRPQVALLVNQRTFVPVFLELAPAATLLERAPAAIEAVLGLLGVDRAFVAAERDEMRDVRIAPTNDRSVVGVMNEFAFHGECHWKDGLHDFGALSVRMADLPLGPLRHRTGYPDRELLALVGGGERSARVIPFPGPRAHEMPTPVRSSPSASVFQLKITLLDTAPPIWRRVLVDGASTLDHVHDVIQAAFGWWNYHLHEFEVGDARYGVPDPDDDWDSVHDERRSRLDSVAGEGSSFRYTYDFGDDWRHRIVVEKVLPVSAGTSVPACVDGRRACPPEDCGGTGGYRDLLAILADPTHPERDVRIDWLGQSFDPELFDRDEFMSSLRNISRATFDDRT